MCTEQYASTIPLILLNDIALDERILTQSFACELNACKGACCTMKGGSGAPLRDDEVELVERSLDVVLEYLTPESREYIHQHGWLDGTEGNLSVQCIDDEECVFVIHENDVARCSLEKAYHDGLTEFRKPISCHLFPIRVADFGGTFLFYETIDECKPARKHGARQNMKIVDSCSEALTREFGEEWTEMARHLAHEGATTYGSGGQNP